MKKRMYQIVALLLSVCMMTGCGAGSTEKKNTVTMNPENYETSETFLTLADLTPNALSPEALQLYSELGLNTFVLTEDFTPFVEDGTLGDGYKASIQAAGDMGMNVWIRNMYNDPDYFQLDADKTGSNYGTPYELTARNLTTEFAEFPAVTGFYMADEPFMITREDDASTDYDESLFSAMDQLGKLVEWKNQYYPDAYWHMNHVPSASYDHWPSGSSYADFIQYYVDNIIKNLTSGGRSICLDNYPLTRAGTIADSYILDLLTVANITRDYNAEAAEDQKATYGICLQTFENANADIRDITSTEDVTFQMYTGMAMGARLFEYFCYRSIGGIGLYGIIDDAGEKRIYDFIQEANDRALPFEKVLCAFEWKGLTSCKGEMSGKDDTFGDIRDMQIEDTGSLTSLSGRYDTIVGCFEKDGQDGYMVVNYTAPNEKLTDVVELTFAGCSQVLVYRESGTEQMNLTEAGELRLSLDAGEGAFVIPQ